MNSALFSFPIIEKIEPYSYFNFIYSSSYLSGPTVVSHHSEWFKYGVIIFLLICSICTWTYVLHVLHLF